MGHSVPFIAEELAKARLSLEKLQRLVNQGLKIIDHEGVKEEATEVAGDLMRLIPETLFAVQQAINAASMGISRMDYDDLKEEVPQRKVRDFEQTLKDERIVEQGKRRRAISALPTSKPSLPGSGLPFSLGYQTYAKPSYDYRDTSEVGFPVEDEAEILMKPDSFGPKKSKNAYLHLYLH